MAPDCFGPEDLDTLIEDRGTPDQLAHLEDCPDCRVLLAEYRCFLAAEPAAGARPEDFSMQMPAAGPAPAPDADHRPGVWQSLFGGRWRPALAAACVAAAVLVLILPTDRELHNSPSGTLRGDGSEATGLAISTIELRADGSWRVAWSAQEGADNYRVDVLDITLTSVATFEAGEAQEYLIGADAAPPGDGPFFVTVSAFSGRRRVDRTPPHELGRAR